eukprot:6428576-Amphidinium_carterae.1
MDNLEIVMWNGLISQQCSPTVLNKLHQSRLIVPIEDERWGETTIFLKDTIIEFLLTPPIQRDNFNPLAPHNEDGVQYLWFTWLNTTAQYQQLNKTGQVPGYKDTRGDNVHNHHWFHNTPDHCVNLHIHNRTLNRWNAASDNDNYGSNKPIYLLAWK